MRGVGRYTVEGGGQVEARVAAAVEAATETARRVLPESAIRALVLIGGYGRGEGGIEVRNGAEHPQNNLDLLLITRRLDRTRTEVLRSRLAEALEEPARDHAIGMDAGAVPDWVLRTDVCRVMWYEMRFGHRTLLGDAAFVPSLSRFTVNRLHPPDLRDLVVNRGTLLVINDALAGLPRMSDEARRAFLRHLVKGVIGIGDGLLWALGAYHWSYRERRRRIVRLPGVPSPLRDLYDRAMAYRFRADPTRLPDPDPVRLQQEVRGVLSEAHRAFEARRLGRPLDHWGGYLEAALSREARPPVFSPREAARRALSLTRTLLGRGPLAQPPPGMGAGASLSWTLCPPRERLALIFPAVAWQVRDEPDASQVRAILGARDAAAMRRAYLLAFGRLADPNFPAAARRLGLFPEEDPR